MGSFKEILSEEVTFDPKPNDKKEPVCIWRSERPARAQRTDCHRAGGQERKGL